MRKDLIKLFITPFCIENSTFESKKIRFFFEIDFQNHESEVHNKWVDPEGRCKGYDMKEVD
jgi:hypothetical protein